MVGHDLHLDDLEMEAICHLPGYLLEALVHAVHQHRPAVLRAEDHVVLAAADDAAAALAFHAGIMPLADSYRLTAMRGLTPCLKEGACAALLVSAKFSYLASLDGAVPETFGWESSHEQRT